MQVSVLMEVDTVNLSLKDISTFYGSLTLKPVNIDYYEEI
jgi:hypothetical protein